MSLKIIFVCIIFIFTFKKIRNGNENTSIHNWKKRKFYQCLLAIQIESQPIRFNSCICFDYELKSFQLSQILVRKYFLNRAK